MRLSRFTVRWLMAAVAVAGIVLGSIPMGLRSLKYSRKGEELGRTESWYDGPAVDAQPIADSQTPQEWAKTCRKIAAWSRAQRLKYEHAARYTWLSVDPDPK